MFLPIKSRLSFTGTDKRVDSFKGTHKSRGTEWAQLPLQMRQIKHIPVCTNILTLISPVAIAPQSSSIPFRDVAITLVNINGIRNSVTLNSKIDWCQQPLGIVFKIYIWEYYFASHIILSGLHILYILKCCYIALNEIKDIWKGKIPRLKMPLELLWKVIFLSFFYHKKDTLF